MRRKPEAFCTTVLIVINVAVFFNLVNVRRYGRCSLYASAWGDV